MSNENTYALLPKLRFPEFLGSPAWGETTIANVCKSFSGGTPNTSQKEFYGGSIPFIRSAEIARDGTELFLTDEGLKRSAAKLIARGDVLVALYGANAGDVALARIDGAINQAILCLKSEGSNAYIYQFLCHRQDWITSTYLQGGQGNLSGDIVKSISVPFPEAAEQKKIADCLISLDELIAAQARKVDALKTHKQGLMQQLFPREGETQPRLRFPEFRDAGDWEDGSISDLATSVMGNAFRSTDFVESGTQVVRIGNLYQGELQLERVPVYLSDTQAGENSKFGVHPLDLLMSMTGTVGKRDYGFVIQVPPDCKPLLLNQRVMKLTAKVKCDPGFLLQLLKSDRLLDAIYSVPGGTKQANLSAQHIKDMSISYPPKSEQQRIALCLNRLDALITLETQELETLKTHKKGLMQQLFPSAEAVEA